MEGSTLFSLCPACHVRARIQRAQAGLRCASCNFDFASLANDSTGRERWMIENLREGSVEMTITLNQLIMQVREPDSRAQVLAFMQRHGIAMPKGGSAGLVAIGAVILLGLAAIGIAIALLIRP